MQTYSAERHAVAQDLINFDRKWAKMLSTPADADGSTASRTQDYFVQQGRYTAGVATHYAPSMLCQDGRYQHLAEGFTIGMRFHSAPVVRLADAKPVKLGHTVKADGRWRLFLFNNREDPRVEGSLLRNLCIFLERSDTSPVRRYTPERADVDALIDVRAIFQQGHRELSVDEMPSLLLPAKGRYGLTDYEKMFCPDVKSGNDIFDLRGIDREQGCMVIVRPDQYVAGVLPLEAEAELASFFEAFMIPNR